MKHPLALAQTLFTLAGVGSAATGLAELIIPGGTVEPYATTSWPAWMSFDRNEGVLFAGVETGGPVRIWRIAAGGAPVDTYGANPILDPDAVLHDALGLMTGEAGSVLVGGRNGGTPAIWAILPDEAQSVVSVFGPSNEWTNISDMEFDSSGRLLFGDEDGQNGRVLATANPNETPSELFAVGGRLAGLEVDALDRIYTSTFDGRVRVHAADGGVIHDPLLSGLGNRILPIAVGPGGPWGTDLYTVNQHTGDLIRADSAGDTTVVGTGFDGFLIDFEFGPDSALYVSDLGLGTIWRISLQQTTAAEEVSGESRGGLRIMHPNPFRSPAAIGYDVPGSGRALLRIFDVNGRLVRTLVDGHVESGVHAADWDGRDATGRPVPSGSYLFRLDTSLDTQASKGLLLR